MKKMKVKSIALSCLMAVVLSAFMLSCEQEDAITPDVESEVTDPSLNDDISDRGDYSFD